MEKLNIGTPQRYFDPETKKPLQLIFQPHQEVFDGVVVEMDHVPLLINSENNAISYPDKTKYLIQHFVNEAKENGHSKISLYPKKRNVRYPFAKEFDFKYSHIDYEYIPGLVRPWDDGFLTPLFFNIEVLNKYSQNPEYKVDLFSSTYGTIYKGNEWYISFGINKNKKVIMWLGDIDGLPDNEKYYLRSENTESDHDIQSEFYNAQIEVQFSEPSPLIDSFHQRQNINELILKKFGFNLFILHGEISKTLENLDRPVFWEEKHVSPFIESLNRIFVESINSKDIKKYLRQNHPEIDVSGMKGLKLFQKWIETCFDTDQFGLLMLPLFVLYDFRIISSHLVTEEKRNEMKQSICDRLKIENQDDNYEVIFDNLIGKILNNYKEIIELINR